MVWNGWDNKPHIAVLNEKERHEINLAVQQQQQINAKKVQDIKRLQQQQAQKLAQQRKGVNSLKTPIQTKVDLDVDPWTGFWNGVQVTREAERACRL